MSNILILTAGRRVELLEAFREDVKKRNLDTKIFATDSKPELSAACQVADAAFESPRVDHTSFLDFLLKLCLTHEIRLIVPTIDTGLLRLAQSKKLFASHNITIAISDEDIIRQCRDKRLTPRLFLQLGVRSPNIYDRNALQFPCFAKPFDGSCSIGASKVETAADLTDSMRGDRNLIFMELVPETFGEYTVDAYFDLRGAVRCLVPRERIEIRSGEISKGATRKNFVYEKLIKSISQCKGMFGCMTIQVFANMLTEEIIGIEINPRFGGGFPLSYAAGAHFPGFLMDEVFFGRTIEFYDDWEVNLCMLRYDAKVLVRNA